VQEAKQALTPGVGAKPALPPRAVLFAVAATRYLPRTMQEVDGAAAVAAVAPLVNEEAAAPLAMVGSLAKCLAANEFLGLASPLREELELTSSQAPEKQMPQLTAEDGFAALAERTTLHALVASLVVHIAGAFTNDPAAVNPLAEYALEPQACKELWMLASPGNEEAMILKAVSAADGKGLTPYSCQCGFKFLVADCGGTNQAGRCPTCKRPIGNVAGAGDYTPAAGQMRLNANGQWEEASKAPGAPIDANAAMDRLPDQPGYLRHANEDLENPFYALQRAGSTIGSIAFRTLHLLVHLSLLAGHLLREACTKTPAEDEAAVRSSAVQLGGLLHNQIDLGIGDAALQCWRYALLDLDTLHQLLPSCSNEGLCAFLHKIIEELPAWCGELQRQASAGQPSKLNSAVKRNAWETSFESKYIKPFSSTMQDRVQQCVASYGVSTEVPLICRTIDEDRALLDEKLTAEQLYRPVLMRIITVPTDRVLKTGFFSDPVNLEKHQFLNLVLRTQTAIQLPCFCHLLLPHPCQHALHLMPPAGHETLIRALQYMWPILDWERFLRDNYSRKIARPSDEERVSGSVTVEKALFGEDVDKDVKLQAKPKYEALVKAFNGLVQMIQQSPKLATRYEDMAGCRNGRVAKEQLEQHKLKALNSRQKLSYVCLDDKDEGLLLLTFLKVLASLQNDFLEQVLAMVPTCAALKAFDMGGGAVSFNPKSKQQVSHPVRAAHTSRHPFVAVARCRRASKLSCKSCSRRTFCNRGPTWKPALRAMTTY
jgi:hypothetical protein